MTPGSHRERRPGDEPRTYEIRVAGSLSAALEHALAGLRPRHVGPCAVVRVEVQGDMDAVDVARVFRERGRPVPSIRRVGPTPGQDRAVSAGQPSAGRR
jgi:hypothetical protein